MGVDLAATLERYGVPPMFLTTSMDKMAEEPLMSTKAEYPLPDFTFARKNEHGRPLPQAIAHRGYKAKYPENTLAAFEAAVKAGAHAIETDIHLSKDGVVVLSHDADLKRCFKDPRKLIDCEWEELSKLRTVQEPHVPMPRLRDLLEYLARPGLEEIWVMLDIKLDNDAEDVMRLIALTIDSVAPNKERPWKNRIVLGTWARKYLPLCSKYLAGFPVSYIGFSIPYARKLFSVPNVSFNILQPVLQGPGGSAFIRDARKLGRPVYAWTVNRPERMRWCLRAELDGVITDDPKTFLEESDEWEGQGRPVLEWYGVESWADVLKLSLMAVMFNILFRVLSWKYKIR